jgi:hypothetical protein
VDVDCCCFDINFGNSGDVTAPGDGSSQNNPPLSWWRRFINAMANLFGIPAIVVEIIIFSLLGLIAVLFIWGIFKKVTG